MTKTKDEVKAAVPATASAAALPVSWQEEMDRQAKAAKAMEPMQGRFISLRGGVLTFQNNPLPSNPYPFIILDSVIEHQLYTKAFDPNSAASPDCYAFGRVSQEMKPHADAEHKQAALCSTCPKFQWGSDPKGGKGKACREVRRLALLDGSLVEKGPEAISKGEVVFVKLPVTSVRNWASYVHQLDNVVHRAPWGVVTALGVSPDPKTMISVKFALHAQFGPDILAAVAEKRKQLGDDGIMFPYKIGGTAAPATPEEQAAAKKREEEEAARRSARKF